MRDGFSRRAGDPAVISRRRGDPATRAAASLLVNGVRRPWRADLTIAVVVREQRADEAAVATAINGIFVPHGARAFVRVAPDDVVRIFSTVAGG